MAKLGLPMVAVDPALTLLYREEYKEILKESRGDFKVLLAHEWLREVIKKGELENCKNRQIPTACRGIYFLTAPNPPPCQTQ